MAVSKLRPQMLKKKHLYAKSRLIFLGDLRLAESTRRERGVNIDKVQAKLKNRKNHFALVEGTVYGDKEASGLESLF